MQLKPQKLINCLLNCSMSKLCSINQEIIHSIFNDAVKAGDYDVMYDLLDNQSDKKKKFFMYEKSLLAFHLGKHNEAVQGYKSVLKNSSDEKSRKKLMLGIIEASHGTIDTHVSSFINDCLNELRNCEDPYYELIRKTKDLIVPAFKVTFKNSKTFRLIYCAEK